MQCRLSFELNLHVLEFPYTCTALNVLKAIPRQRSQGILRTHSNKSNEPHRDRTNKMACASSEDSDQLGHPPSLSSLHCPLEESLVPLLPIKRATAKTLNRLGGCPGWSESSLGAHAILLDLSRCGSYAFCSSYSWRTRKHHHYTIICH